MNSNTLLSFSVFYNGKKYFRIRRIILLKQSVIILISAFVVSTSLWAAENKSSISVEIGRDEQGNKNSLVAVNLALDDEKNALFGFGKSEVPTSNELINSNLFYFGVSKKQSKNWKVTGMMEYAGQKDFFTTFSLSAPIRYSQNDYFLEVIPGWRNITLNTNFKKKVLISSQTLGLKAGLYAGEHFRVSGSVYSFTYNRNVAALSSPVIYNLFNDKTLSLSGGLLSKSYNLETGLDYDSFSWSLGSSRSISAIDNSSSDYIYTTFDYILSDKWSVGLLYGKYLKAPLDFDNYSSINVNYQF